MHRIVIQCAVLKNIMPAARQLRKWARDILKNQTTQAVEITIRIVTPLEMIKLNTQYRHKENVTNVLSFPYGSKNITINTKKEPLLLGDIVICADVVNQEAIAQAKKPIAHWAHIVTHGILHLLGYDHEVEADAILMESLEVRMLESLGFPNPYKSQEY
ncbi:MAG: ybeY [Gammaproteobacteria bacterium]|jgi:probable rRNA maturation factor|nr:ybeY [Gammaproteobacteria bacterium]